MKIIGKMQWSRLLLYSYQRFEELQARDVNSFWNKISSELVSLGYKKSAAECKNKFEKLKEKYKTTVDNNSRSGASLKKCDYYDVSICKFLYL